MFKKFDEKEDVSSVTNAKNSRAKAIRKRVCEDYGFDVEIMDQIIPKKDTLKLVKCHEHIELFADGQGDVLFFCQREGPFIPSLKLLHKYPFMLPHLQVDRGAIKHVLNGSNIMCPGLTSPGARMTQVPQGSVVAVMAEGKEYALAVGITSMSTDEILSINKGIGVENVHYLNDGLWRLKPSLLSQVLVRRVFACLLCCFVFLFLIELSFWISSENEYDSCHSSVAAHYSEHRLAIIIPYRDRWMELRLLLPHLHRFLVQQNVLHSFYVVNQVDKLRFNRGALLNAGFIESSQIEKYGRKVLFSHNSNKHQPCFPLSDYVALHDVDLLPLDPNILYTWPGDQGPYHPIPAPFHPRYYWYAKYFGGVLIITREQFAHVNGMSNSFWGWGAEDDEFRGRVVRAQYVISSPKTLPLGINSFRSIHNTKLHVRDSSTYYDPRVRRLISTAHGGLSTTNYTVVSRDVLHVDGISFVMISVQLKCNMPIDLCQSNITERRVR